MQTFAGYVALIGRPNVGKSTLLNRLLQKKISITSRKPQTTRHRVIGVVTEADCQFVFVDTPGIHQKQAKAINKIMNRTAASIIHEVDVVLFMIDATAWDAEDDFVLKKLQNTTVPVILILNKVDKIADKKTLLPLIEKLAAMHNFASIVPLAAKANDEPAQQQIHALLNEIKKFLPESPFYYAADQITDRSVSFLCAEILREKVFRLTGQELPYATNVAIESFKEEDNLVRIHALIYVEKENHKRMIIGDCGQKLKEIASKARIDLEQLLEKKVFLKCWCQVKTGWTDNIKMLKQLGYE